VSPLTRRLRSRRWQLIGLAAIAVYLLSSLTVLGAIGPTHATTGTAHDMTNHLNSQDATGATSASVAGVERVYYIAADRVEWDFAPFHTNRITGLPFGDTENVFVKRGSDRIGSKYLMSQYRRYTDARFTARIERSAQDAYLGILGPTIRAVVGDTIRVVFKNNTPFPASIHPHGVFYRKDSEGAPYADGTHDGAKADDAVPPGRTHTYHWRVPERAGPAEMDPSSVMWMYHSHTDEVRDTNTGLVGAIVITRAGMAKADGSPRDVDREVFSHFSVMNQNQSLYIDQDIQKYTGNPSSVNKDDEGFIESNLMHGINGYVYGNMPMIDLRKGERVRWYTMALGTEVDLHSPHWHGNTLAMNGMMRTDMVSLLPGMMVSADMTPDDPGKWLFHCHVNDHILAGMQTRYRVIP
jgi:manganese oxidase